MRRSIYSLNKPKAHATAASNKIGPKEMIAQPSAMPIDITITNPKNPRININSAKQPSMFLECMHPPHACAEQVIIISICSFLEESINLILIDSTGAERFAHMAKNSKSIAICTCEPDFNFGMFRHGYLMCDMNR